MLSIGGIKVDLFTLACGPVHHDVMLLDKNNISVGRIEFDCIFEHVASILLFLPLFHFLPLLLLLLSLFILFVLLLNVKIWRCPWEMLLYVYQTILNTREDSKYTSRYLFVQTPSIPSSSPPPPPPPPPSFFLCLIYFSRSDVIYKTDISKMSNAFFHWQRLSTVRRNASTKVPLLSSFLLLSSLISLSTLSIFLLSSFLSLSTLF